MRWRGAQPCWRTPMHLRQRCRPNAAAYALSTAAETLAWSAYVGYDAHMLTASVALHLCSVATSVSVARTLNLPETTAAACSVFVARAFDMIQMRTGAASMPEGGLMRNAQIAFDEQQRLRARHMRMASAYPHRVASPAEQRRAAAARHSARHEPRHGIQHAPKKHGGGDCGRASPARLRAAHLRRARGARLAVQALLRVPERRLLLQGAPSAGLACAQSSLPRGAQSGGAS
jgi:hypothetical protein